ncbi:MAG: response regulator [Chloroflexi bacterium]|nr:response regulator [Chloroflexota bacterium]
MVGGKRRILVVEDDPTVCLVLRDALEDEGYTIRVARNGTQALAALEEWQPDVIVLDLLLPAVNGREFRTQQLVHPEHARVPVVLLSAVQDLPVEAARLGAAAALAKPFDLDELLATVRAVLPR